MVVLGIMAILFGIAVPALSAYIHLSQFRRNDSYAKTMYLAAESSLTYHRTGHRTGGDWEDFALDIERAGTQSFPDDDSLQSIYALRLDLDEYSAQTRSADGELAVDLLDTDIYDKGMLNAAICLEIDITSGQVYSVFYGTNCTGLYYSQETGIHDGALCIDSGKRDYETRRAERLGYYSVEDTANVSDLKPVRLKITSLNLLNGETLTLNWASNSKHQDLDVEYTINFYKKNDSSTPLMTISGLRLSELHGSTTPKLQVKLKDSAQASEYVFPLRYETGRFTLTLDAMMNADLIQSLAQNPDWAAENSTSITRFAGFEQPMDIYATVKASPTYENMGDDASEYRESAETKSNDANTMFADGATADKAGITAFRHLSNIRYIDHAADFTVNTRTLDWKSGSVTVYGIETQQTAEGAKGSSLTAKNDTAFPTIPELRSDQTLDGSGGILGRAVGLLTGGNTIEGVVLDDSSTPADGSLHYIGLFSQNHGTISGLKLTNASLTAEGSSWFGAGTVCGMSDGSMQNVSVSSDSSINVTLSGTGSQPFGIGGVVGILNLSNNAKATGLAADGTVQGVLPSGRTGGVGGIVGYAKNAVLEKCTSSAGRGKFIFDGSLEQRDRYLYGKYVGGIVGYGEKGMLRSCSTGSGGYVLGDEYVGGIIGGLDGTTNSYLSSASVTTNASYVIGNSHVGGIIGVNKAGSVIDRCVNTGVAAGYGKYIGGIVGENEKDAIVTDCASYISDTKGEIYDLVTSWNAIGDFAGGIAGINRGTIAFNDENKQLSARSISAIVVGRNFVGGVTGFNEGTLDISRYELIGGRVAATARRERKRRHGSADRQAPEFAARPRHLDRCVRYSYRAV